MRWDAFYDDNSDPAHQVRPGGLMHGGFYPYEDGRPGGTYRGTHIGGDPVWLTTHHYDTAVSETRITTYLGILTGQVPATAYYATWRTFPTRATGRGRSPARRASTGRTSASTSTRAPYTYRGMQSCRAGAARCSRSSCRTSSSTRPAGHRTAGVANHPLHVRAQREHGLIEAGYGYWGFSPSSDPFAGYREYGVDALGLNPDGYFSDKEKTNYDPGFGDCRPATNPSPTYGDGS